MKSTITQFVTLGIMLLIMAVIVSLYPEQNNSGTTSQAATPTKVSKLSIQHRIRNIRAD